MSKLITGFGNYQFGTPVSELGVSLIVTEWEYSLLTLRLVEAPQETLTIGTENRTFQVNLGYLKPEMELLQIGIHLEARTNENFHPIESIKKVGDHLVALLCRKYQSASIETEGTSEFSKTIILDEEGNSITAHHNSEILSLFYDSKLLNELLDNNREANLVDEVRTLERQKENNRVGEKKTYEKL